MCVSLSLSAIASLTAAAAAATIPIMRLLADDIQLLHFI